MAPVGTTSMLTNRVRNFVATVSIKGSHPKLLPDLSAAVDVELERKDNVMVVPRDAVARDNDTFTVRVARRRQRAVSDGHARCHERPRSDCRVGPRAGSDGATPCGAIKSGRFLPGVAGVAIVIALAGVSGVFGRSSAVDVPTTAIVKGEFIDYLQVRGEVKAMRSVALTVPQTGGGDLQILELAANGMAIKKGDVVVKFDPMTVERTLNDRRSEHKQAEEEIGKTRAQYRIQEQQAQTDRTKARYDVRRAELDAVPSEFLPRMEREQKELALRDAKARFAEAERKLKALGDIEKAELGSKIQKRDKSRYDMDHAHASLAVSRYWHRWMA